MFESTKVIELGSCAFRQWKAGMNNNRPGAGDNSKRCSFVHGYQLKAKLWFGCRELDDKNWAVDFGGLKDLEKIFKTQFDHTLMVSETDPCLELFKQLHDRAGCDLRIVPAVGIEMAAEWVFNTTAEYILKVTGGRCWVNKVEVWEHDRNSATYSAPVPTFSNN